MKSTIRLFKALPIKFKKDKEASETLLNHAIKKGFIFSPEVVANYSEQELLKYIEDIGLTPEQMNSSFHKSWEKVRTADIEQLVMEQLVHYFTTYGFEALGIYSEDSVYIPNEKLEIPEVLDLNLTIIKGYTHDELKEKLLKLLTMGVALKEDTIKDVLDVALFVRLSEDEIESVRNKEVKIALYDYLGLIPSIPTEFLRFCVYKSTDKTLLIKSPEAITEIKGTQNIDVIRLFEKYEAKYGLDKLAETFYRFKPLYLAFRTNKRLKVIINKIRRLAVKNHKPMPEDYLNSVTANLSRCVRQKKKMLAELKKVNVFRKIRLMYALNYRTKEQESILYQVRNGKGYATKLCSTDYELAKKVLKIVKDSLVEDLREKVEGKKIYIPDGVGYALPATQKQFVGNFPAGSYISADKDMIMGVHWDNVDGNRIDLDLSLLSPDIGKIGWDSSYRADDRSVLFSGDITDAPKGASELFYIKKQKRDAYIMFLNYYNYDDSIDVPFKIIVAQEPVKRLTKNYTIDPNNVKGIVESKINKKEKLIGLVMTTPDECRFYFVEANMGSSITSSGTEYAHHTRRYLFSFYENMISLKEILESAGAILLNMNNGADVDLSPNVIEKDTILNLLV